MDQLDVFNKEHALNLQAQMIFVKKLQPQMDPVIDKNRPQVLVLPPIQAVGMLLLPSILIFYANHGAHNASSTELDVWQKHQRPVAVFHNQYAHFIKLLLDYTVIWQILV